MKVFLTFSFLPILPEKPIFLVKISGKYFKVKFCSQKLSILTNLKLRELAC
jgi:hypothetical protein